MTDRMILRLAQEALLVGGMVLLWIGLVGVLGDLPDRDRAIADLRPAPVLSQQAVEPLRVSPLTGFDHTIAGETK